MVTDLDAKATISGFAELIGVDRKAARKHAELLVEDGTFREWLIDYCKRQREVASGRGGDDQYELTAERARLAHHQANKTALEEKELTGELIRVEDVTDRWVNAITNCKTRLLSMPNKLTHQILAADDHKSALEIFETGIHEALEELASGDVRKARPLS